MIRKEWKRQIYGVLTAGVLCALAAGTVYAAEEQTEKQTESAAAVVCTVSDTESDAIDAALLEQISLTQITEIQITESDGTISATIQVEKKTDENDATLTDSQTEISETTSEEDTKESMEENTEENTEAVSDETEQQSEAAPEKRGILTLYKTPSVRYTKVRLNVRQTPDTEGKLLKTLEIAEELSVLGETDGWYLIQDGEEYGFVSGEYVTESEEEAKALKAQAEEEARKRAEAQAAAEAQARAQAQAQAQANQKKSGKNSKKESSKKDSSKKKKTEVSRENVPSCENSKHGVTYITYSDGSVEAVEY